MKNIMSVNGEKWIVSLSDGRTIEEHQLCDEPQRISPWGKLEEILEGDGVYITQLRIQVLGRTYVCPSRSDRAKFPCEPKPTNYLCMRKIAVDALKVNNVISQCIGMQAELPTGVKVVTWVDVYTGDSWQQVTK